MEADSAGEAGPANSSKLRGWTYPHLKIKDHNLDQNPRLHPAKLFTSKSPASDLGHLETLPVELIQMILPFLDIRSLTNFRYVNTQATIVTDSIPQYSAIAKHAPNILMAILSIGTAQRIACHMLYEKLCTAECEECGDFGGYLYLLTYKRVCFLCFSTNKSYLPLSLREATRKYGIDQSVMARLPRMSSIPGTCSPGERKRSNRLTLVDSDSARNAGIAEHGSPSAMEAHTSAVMNRRLEGYYARMDEAMTIPPGYVIRHPRQPRTMDPFDEGAKNPLRFMAIVRAPRLKLSSQESEWGFHCVGCRGVEINRTMHFSRQFDAVSFDEHLRECGGIEDGRHRDEAGTGEV